MMLARARISAARAGRTAGLWALAGLLALPGLGLVTHAAWVLLAATHGAAVASLVTGALWLAGAVAAMAAAGRRPPPPPPPPAAALPIAALIEAFVQGMTLARGPAPRPSPPPTAADRP